MEARTSIKEYMDYATIHGVGRSKNSPFLVLRLLWIVALCGCLGIIFWQVYELHAKFQSGPIITSIGIRNAQQLAFPSLLICNKNPLLFSKIPSDSDLYRLVQDAATKYSVDLSIYDGTEDIYSQNFTSFDQQVGDQPIDKGMLRETEETFKMLMSILDEQTLVAMSQDISDFIVLCNFLGQPCTDDMFIPHRTYDYGMCYIFDPVGASYLNGGKTSVTGATNSLEFIFYVDQNDSIPFVTSSTGVVLQAGLSQESTGFVDIDDSSNVYVPTGFEVNVGYQHILFDRVPGTGETKRCNDDPYTMGLAECKRDCIQDLIDSICSCYQYYFMVGEINSTVLLDTTKVDELDFRPCYTEADRACILQVNDLIVSKPPKGCESCLPHCTETVFKKDVSMFTWPNEYFSPVLRRMILSKPTLQKIIPYMTREFVRNNLALVRVYLSTLTYEHLQESYAYSAVDFISDIGGQLGLWAGFSILSLLELLELIIILLSGIRKKKQSNTSVSTLK